MKKLGLLIVLVGLFSMGVMTVASLAKNGPPGKSGDDTTTSCPPGYGGDPCVHNGDGHGNCGDNQGGGQNGNDNGFGHKPGCTSTEVSTSTLTTTVTEPTSTTSRTVTDPRTTPVPSTTQPVSVMTVTGRSITTSGLPPAPKPKPSSRPITTLKATPHRATKPKVEQLVTPTAQPTGLPFTGFPLWIVAAASLGAIGLGLALSRRAWRR